MVEHYSLYEGITYASRNGNPEIFSWVFPALSKEYAKKVMRIEISDHYKTQELVNQARENLQVKRVRVKGWKISAVPLEQRVSSK